MSWKKAIFAISLLSLFQNGHASNATETTFRAISYNTWGLPRPFLSKPGRFKKIQKIIGSFNADIIAFQETFTNYAKVLKKIEGYPYVLEGPGKKKGKSISSGLLILSKFPILESGQMVFTKCSGTDCLASKGVMWAKIDVPDVGPINVFNIHTNAGSNKKVKMHQLEEAYAFIEQYQDDRPTLFLGDFNVTPESDYYNYLASVMGFQDALDLYLRDNPEYRNDPTVIYSFRIGKNFYKARPDYFWSKDGDHSSIIPSSYSVILNKINGPKLSDHFAIMADFILAPF